MHSALLGGRPVRLCGRRLTGVRTGSSLSGVRYTILLGLRGLWLRGMLRLLRRLRVLVRCSTGRRGCTVREIMRDMRGW